jgi:transcriptional regulator with XRE-family HTH domain
MTTRRGESVGESFDDVFDAYEQSADYRRERRRLKPYYELIAQIINRRTSLGLTQRDLAARAGTHQSRISKIESGEHDIRLSTLVQLAEALGREVAIRLVPQQDEPMEMQDYPAAQALFVTTPVVTGIGAVSQVSEADQAGDTVLSKQLDGTRS